MAFSIALLLTGSIHSSAATLGDTIPSGQLTNSELFQQLHQKSKKQKTAAWILLGGGALCNIISAAVVSKNFQVLGGTPSQNSQTTHGFVAAIVGSAAMLASVPFFIASKKNKKRAANFSVGTEIFPAAQNGNLVCKPMQSLKLTIAL